MSLILASLLKNKSPKGYQNERFERSNLKKNSAWLLSYIALFTSLLAFFILTISLVQLETSDPKRSFQNLISKLHNQVVYHRDQAGIPWLQVDRSMTRGIRITLPADLIPSETLFESAKTKINPRFLPYLRKVVELFNRIGIESLPEEHARLIRDIETPGYKLKFMIKVEGHTDANAMAETARFRSNVELSTYRAYALMDWLRIHLGLPKSQFSIAGYGGLRPLVANPLDPVNRRIEIYLIPQLIPELSREPIFVDGVLQETMPLEVETVQAIEDLL